MLRLLRCKILCEGANGPTTTVADDILEEKKVFVVPDILANAGGVTASYFEWVQDRMGYFWTEVEVNQRLDAIMTESFKDVVAYAEVARGEQPDCGVHAGDRPGGVHDEAAWYVRVICWRFRVVNVVKRPHANVVRGASLLAISDYGVIGVAAPFLVQPLLFRGWLR